VDNSESPSRSWACWLLLAAALLSSHVGCTRRHYRQQADAETAYVVAEKSTDPRWALPGFTIEQDPRSRYFDPYNPDCPPMPPDDPYSHEYMHYVDRKKGWPYWHRHGDRTELENPGWREYLNSYAPINERGEVILSIDSSLDIAYLHSPTYQTQLETLYLSALDVTTERFRLDTQFFGGVDTTFIHTGNARANGFETNVLQIDSDLSARRRFATAGELAVGFANSMVWEFAGGNTDNTLSILSFNLVQPLLRAAGRDIALEQLTIVERGMLANLRAFQQYRQGFYTNVAIGESGVAGPQRRGGFFGGTGLSGFTGTGAGGLGGVGEATGFGRAGFGGGGAGGGGGGAAGLAGGGAGTVGGFIGLLQRQQEIQNTKDSLVLQNDTLRRLEEILRAGRIDLVQVDQFRQSIETENANLLQAENTLATALDAFKTGTLGMPPDLPVALDSRLIQQFQFVDPILTQIQIQISMLQSAVGELPAMPTADDLADIVTRATAVFEAASLQFGVVEADMEKLQDPDIKNLIEKRLEHASDLDRQDFETDMRLLSESLENLRFRMGISGPALEEIRQGLGTDAVDTTIDKLVAWLGDFYGMQQELGLIQARARLESVVVEPVELDTDLELKIAQQRALRIALSNRLDLMNNRANLVDSWRLIAFNADALQAGLNIVMSGDMRTSRDNPFSFQGSNSVVRAGLQFDAPFTRLLERNNYRQSLIDYQRDRRQFIQSIDGLNSTMRATLRQLRQLGLNLEIQRKATVISIRRVDLTREELTQPVAPAEPGQPSNQLGPTAALNLLSALSDLRSTQNNFMSVWLNYYATRMRLVRELGVMKIDDQGRWIDDQSINDILENQVEELPLPPPIPDSLYQPIPEVDTGVHPLEEIDGYESGAPRSEAEEILQVNYGPEPSRGTPQPQGPVKAAAAPLPGGHPVGERR